MKRMRMNKDYYQTCAFPKPGKTKKKTLSNGYKDKANRYCYYCGTAYAERHEVYPGPNRQTCIREGFQVDLCHDCHEEMQRNLTERGKARNLYWKKYYQKRYEEKLIQNGTSKEDARKMWMAMIGRNYQEDVL